MDKYIIIGQALVSVVLVIIIVCQKLKFDRDYEDLAEEYETECSLRALETACNKIFLKHYKEQKDKEIKLLREALHASEEKRKELCERLRLKDEVLRAVEGKANE